MMDSKLSLLFEQTLSKILFRGNLYSVSCNLSFIIMFTTRIFMIVFLILFEKNIMGFIIVVFNNPLHCNISVIIMSCFTRRKIFTVFRNSLRKISRFFIIVVFNKPLFFNISVIIISYCTRQKCMTVYRDYSRKMSWVL